MDGVEDQLTEFRKIGKLFPKIVGITKLRWK